MQKYFSLLWNLLNPSSSVEVTVHYEHHFNNEVISQILWITCIYICHECENKDKWIGLISIKIHPSVLAVFG